MANVTDSASLLTIPSGWSDGVLGSLKPDDGSGDFTFSRGSDLSATRVNEDGYIEKGYENLLLQSNQFDTTWTTSNASVTGGQSGYDGSTDAWQLTSTTTGSAQRVQQSFAAVTGVYNFSVYAKAGTYNQDLYFRVVGSINYRAYFDLSDGSLQGGSDLITYKSTNVGNGWYRYEVSFNVNGASNFEIRFRNTNDTGSYFYIQDAMLNQGLVAYPYIETTTATAKNATILEDQPRIDYTSGNGAVLIEPSSTNKVVNSENPVYTFNEGLIINQNYSLSPEGIINANKIIPTTANSRHNLRLNYSTPGGFDIISCFVKQDGYSNVQIASWATGADYINFNLSGNGSVATTGSSGPSIYGIEPYRDGWFRIYANVKASGSGLIGIGVITNPSSIWAESFIGNGNDGILIYGIQIEESTKPTSYIPTYGISTTRAKDTATLTKNVASTGTIYININSNSTKTLTFLGGNVSVIKGTNKIAMAYSPTALKISHNGSVVQNITRAFDTSALTQIQLGHRNNFEQTTDGINQFLTLDSFLLDADLNELTA